MTRQQKGGDGRNDSEVQKPRERLTLRAGHFHEIFEIAQAQSRLHRHILSDARDGHAPVGAVDETHTQQRLELLNRNTEGGLGYETGLRRPAEVVVFHQRGEVTELPDGGQTIHGCGPEP